jgi:predicted transposase/invertase (TIGR01784 family)
MQVIKTKRGLEILLPKMDFIFKIIFGDEHNKPLLKSFLQAVLFLAEDEFEIALVNPYLQPQEIDGKLSILDVKIRTKTGKLIDIEMQILRTENIFERVCYYQSMMVVEQVGKGESYDRIKKVINIVITDFNFVEGLRKDKKKARYHHCFRLYDPQDKAYFGDVEEIHTIELPKLPAQSDDTAIWDWVKYIAVETEEDLTMLAEKNDVLRHAVDELYRVSASDEVRAQYEAREKAWRDDYSRMIYAENKGLKEGRAKGLKEGLKEGIKKGRAEARAESKAQIAQLKAESKAEIEQLKRELARFQQNHD